MSSLLRFLLYPVCLRDLIFIVFVVGWQWVLSDSKFNFPYPVGLTLLHMVFSTVLCFLVVRVFEVWAQNTSALLVQVMCLIHSSEEQLELS